MEKVNLKFRVSKTSVFITNMFLYPIMLLNILTFKIFADSLFSLCVKISRVIIQVKEVK